MTIKLILAFLVMFWLAMIALDVFVAVVVIAAVSMLVIYLWEEYNV